MTNATTNVARVAAAVAGFGLVAMSFAPLAGAQTTTTTTTTTTSSATFTRDLTIGSTGADVTALQTWLISKGYSIPAGATGYFGAQTKAALAAYQAASGITPAAGYFGPITRAKVNAAGGSTGSTGGSTGGSSTGGLSGGEADLNNFDLVGGDDLMEGDSDTEIAVAKFDVDDGDVEIQRVTLDFQPTKSSASANEHPWEYVDSLSVYLDGKKIGDVDAGSKSDWDDADDDSDHSGSLDYYTIDIPVKGVVREGDRAELSIRADAQSSIDTDDQDQTFNVQVPDDGIRAVDAQGIQQYVGDGEEISLGFDAAEDGDLTVRKSSDNPNAGVLVADSDATSDEFEVLKGEIKNKDNADVDFNELVFNVATTTASGSPASDITDIIRRATLDLGGDTYDGEVKSNGTIVFDDLDTTLDGDDTIEFTLSVELYGQSGHYAASGESLTFSLPGDTAHVDAEGADTGDASSVSGSVNGEKQTIAVDAGINVSGGSMTASQTYNSQTPSNSYGTFTMKVDVTASGDDVYVPKSVQAIASSTTPGATTGFVVITDLLASTTSSTVTASVTSTADSANGSAYVVYDGDTETFTITVTIDPSATGDYQVGLDRVRFADNAALSNLQTLDVDQTDDEFQTDPVNIRNS